MIESTTPRYPSTRVNLLHAHGSPTRYLYSNKGCRCAVCCAVEAKYGRSWRTAHPGRNVEQTRNWRAAHPGGRAKHDRRYRANHREDVAAYNRSRREAYPDEARTRLRNYRARKLAAPGTHTAADIAAQYGRQRGKCFWGRKINPACSVSLKAGYHVDHVTPLVKKGSNGTENLVLACPSCNHTKYDKHPMDFAGILF